MNKELSLFEKYIHALIYDVVATVAFLLCCGSYIGVKTPSESHLVIAVCTAMLIVLFSISNRKRKIFCVLFVCAFAGCFVLVTGYSKIVDFLYSYFLWLTGNIGWNEAWIMGYEMIQTIFLAVIICLIEVVLEKYNKLRIVLAGIVLTGLLIAMFVDIVLSHAGVVCAFFYPVLVCIELVQSKWKKHRNRDLKVHTLWITPFLLVYFVAMLFMPSSSEPYDWKFVKEAYQQITETISEMDGLIRGAGENAVASSFMGFSEEARIFGTVSDKEVRELVKVEIENNSKTNIYFTGKIFNAFNGIEWQYTREETDTIRRGDGTIFPRTAMFEDTKKTVQAMQECGNYELSNYLSKNTLQISYPKQKNPVLFLPIKTVYFGEREDGYVLTYYQMNLAADHFDELLTQIHENTPSDEFLDRDFYEQEIVLSEEVKKYLAQITKGARSDIEKLRMIERELLSYTYNHTPRELPDYVIDESSFLDYFLLESKEGFCTHFATAFVLLARAEGIPARYVQGFCVPTNGEKEIVVYSNMAHAWPEVYVNGVGFIPFEPTPGYAAVRYTPWQREEENEAGKEAGKEAGEVLPEKLPENPVQEELAVKEVEEAQVYSGELLEKAAYILMILIIFTFAIVMVDKIRELYHYRKMDVSEKFLALTSANFRILSVLGVRRADHETLEEFSNEVKQMPGYEKEMERFISLYEDVLYGRRAVTEEMFTCVKSINKLLFRIIKKKNRLRYYAEMLILYPYST